MNNRKTAIIIISILTFVIAGTFWYVNYLMNKPLDIEIPKEFTYNGTKIALAWTDDNTGESLIIQSDRKEYNGFSSVDVYFSITNINKRDQDMDVVVWVESEKVRVEGMERLENASQTFITTSPLTPLLNRRGEPSGEGDNPPSYLGGAGGGIDMARGGARKSINGFTTGYSANDQIESGQTNYYKATIKYPAKSNGEFFIEAFGYRISDFGFRILKIKGWALKIRHLTSDI
ncbi:hypothetical protein KKC83_03205 [Patescibacteria group bacterium]|nr:hypothetical protein [Patescibacteria group bacterium]MBU4026522.1 hypothetical protein [Patescibacteria group bacterium]MBU4073036.1 hypothetical protein [Patescibacteria group bacterium]MBU4102855.1 hypothetical protein [Patescibacteria group bacterium]